MKKETKIILFDDPDIVQHRTDLKGWTGADGLYHGTGELGERRARYANSTHKKCDCGEVMEKNWMKCSKCREVSAKEDFEKIEQIEWDGESAMCLYQGDEFFFDMESVHEYCEYSDVDIKDIQLMHCEKQVDLAEVNIDELNEEYMTEDGEGVSHYHPEIAAKAEELNELIRNAEPKLWFQVNKRIKV